MGILRANAAGVQVFLSQFIYFMKGGGPAPQLTHHVAIHGRDRAQFAVSDFQHRPLQITLSRMRSFPRILRSRRIQNTPLFPPPPKSALKLRNMRNLKNFESSRCGLPPKSSLLWSGSTPSEPSRLFDLCEIL